MTGEPTTAALIGSVALLERAINYTLGCLHLVTPAAMSNPTPCRAWDLRALLGHINDSLSALHEAIDIGRIDLEAPEDDGDPAIDPVTTVRNQACRLLGACTSADGHDMISIAGCPLTTSIVTSTGAVEVAVHGWDVAQGCGRHRPIPYALAEEMLELSPLFVTDVDRPARFADPIDVPPLAGPGDRLIAFLGRHPY